MHAVDAAGVHPLLLAIGSERYTPYNPAKQPAEILTIANHILGTGQLSLAKFVFITSDDTNKLSTTNIKSYLEYILQRIHLNRDIHFYTNTTIDTLDYSGTSINSGSKVVLAAYGEIIRELATEVPVCLNEGQNLIGAMMVMPGVVALQINAFTNYEAAAKEVEILNAQLQTKITNLQTVPIIVLCDDAAFVSASMRNFFMGNLYKM